MKCSSPGGGLVVIKPTTHCDVVPFRLRNVEKSSEFDPLTQRQVFHRKESNQWEHPTGPNQFHQYSKVLDEKSTFAPSVHQKEQGTFEFLTSKCGDTNTRAIRSEQKFQEIRHLNNNEDDAGRDGGGCGGVGGWKTRKSSSIRLVTTYESFSTSSSSSTTTKYSKGLLQDVRTVSDLGCCPPQSTNFNGNLSCVHSNGNNSQKKEWELDIASLEKSTQRLDNSLQIEKKNLSQNGSLSRRRPPTRSNLKNIMSEFLNNGNDLSKHVFTENKVNGTSDKCDTKNNEESLLRFESESIITKPVATSVNKSQNSTANFKSSKEVLIQKSIEIPKEVELVLFDARKQQQRTEQIHEEEKEKSKIPTSCHWLQEAKQKLRKCQSSLPIEIPEKASKLDTERISNDERDQEQRRKRVRNNEHYSINSSKTIEMNGHSRNSNLEYRESKKSRETSSRWTYENSEDTEVNRNVVTSTSHDIDLYDYPDINQNNFDNESKQRTGSELFGYDSDSDSEECDTVVENFSLSSVLQKLQNEGCVLSLSLDDGGHCRPEERGEPSGRSEEVVSPSESGEPSRSSETPTEPPVAVTSVLEKNKSKSTSNLDDDETMEAPWFQHPTYQKPSRIVDDMREFAKSSTDLKCVSSLRGNKRVSLRNRPIPEENVVHTSFSEEEEDEEEEITERKAPWMHEVKLKSVTSNFRREKSSSEPPKITSVMTRNGTSSSTAPENVSEVTVNGGCVEVSSQNKTSSELYSNSWASMCHDNVVIIASNENQSNGQKWPEPESRKQDTILSIPLNANCSTRKTNFNEFSTKINVSGPSTISVGLDGRTSGSTLTTVVPPPDNGQFGVSYPRQVKLRKVVTQSTSELHDNRGYGVVPSNRLSVSSPIYSMRFDEESEDDEKRWNVANSVGDREGSPLFKYRLKTFGENVCSPLRTNGIEEVIVTGNSVDVTTWEKLENLDQKAKMKKPNDVQQPEWIKEAEEKTKSWRNLNVLESPQRSPPTSSRASWLEEVKLKRTATSSRASSYDVDTESDGWSPVPPQPHPVDVDAEDDCCTSWKFVHLKSTDKNRVNGNHVRNGHQDVEEPESEESQVMTIEDTSLDYDTTSEDLSTSVKSSDQSQETYDSSSRGSSVLVPNGSELTQSQFDVEGYVKGLISRRRANKDFRRPSEQQSENPEWLQISKEKSKNVDWTSLEKLTGNKKVDSLRLAEVGLQKNGQSSWSKIQKYLSSSEEDEEVLTTTNTNNTGEEKSRSRKLGNNSSIKPPSSLWVSQVQLNSCGSSIRVGGGHDNLVSTCREQEQQIERHPQLKGNTIMSSTTTELITNGSSGGKIENSDTESNKFGKNKNGHSKEKTSKRVTFDIPKARSSPDLHHHHHRGHEDDEEVERNAIGDYPEWIKIAEKKCNKEINWECLDNKQEASSKLTSGNKWITQVQLRHVGTTKSLEECSKSTSEPRRPPPPPTTSTQKKINSNNIVTVNGHHQHHDCDSTVSIVEEIDFGGGIKTSSEVITAPLSSSPDWLKVAERKKKAHINWEQLDSSNDEETQVGPISSVDISSELNGLEKCDTIRTSSPRERSSWHSSDFESDTSSLPTWLHLAEKKKKSSIDWTNIERDISIKTTSSSSSSKVKWKQHGNLRSSSESSVCDENPFHVSLRHVEHEQDSEDVDEEAATSDANITWPVRNGGSDVDRWQVLYKDLFEDLLDESMSAAPYALRLSHSESIGEVHMLKGSSELSRKSKKLTSTLESRQRKRIDFRQHRYYSLPEISCALPRDDHEVEIIQLPTTTTNIEAKNSVNEEIKFDSTDEKNSTLENEDKPIVFVKLKPIDRRKNEQSEEEEEEEEERNRCWLSRIKLRKTQTTVSETMEDSTASTSGYKRKESVCGVGHRGTARIASSVPPLRKPLSEGYSSGFTRTRMFSSPSVTVSSSSSPSSKPLYSIREAIHRDIKKEVARRENKKPTEVTPLPSSSAKELFISETTEKGIGFSPPSKPKWLVELQQKKETQKRAFLSDTSNGSSVATSALITQTTSKNGRTTKSHLDATPPSYLSVMDQIKSMGKEKLFANLRKCPIEVTATATTTTSAAATVTLVPMDSCGHGGTVTMETETTGCFTKKTLIKDEKNINGNVKCGSIVASTRSSDNNSSTTTTTIENYSGSIHDIVNSPFRFSSSSSISSAPTCIVSKTASDVSVAINGGVTATKKPSKTIPAAKKEEEEEEEVEESSRCNNNAKSASTMLKKHFECKLTSSKQLVNDTKDKIGINLKQNSSNGTAKNAKMYSVSSKWRASITNNGSLQQEIVIKNNTMATTRANDDDDKVRTAAAEKEEEECRKERRRNTMEFVTTSKFRHSKIESSSSFDDTSTSAAVATASDELKSPLLLMNLMSCLNKSCSDTNLNMIKHQNKVNGTASASVAAAVTAAAKSTTSSFSITKGRKAATSCSDLSCSVRKPSSIIVKTYDRIGGEKSSSYKSEMSLSLDMPPSPPRDTAIVTDLAPNEAVERNRTAVDQNDFDLKLTTKCVYDLSSDASINNGVAAQD